MSTTFASLGVPAEMARTLDDRGIDEPTPIQAATLPDALAGRDLCGKAPTGSGKTIAFGIPMAARVPRAAPKRPKGLVLTPTRELALQVADELKLLDHKLRVLAVYGGAGIEPQIKALRAGVDIVVACPGRLLDVIDRNACDLRDVGFAVVDEADRMADMGFLPDVRQILDLTNPKRQTLLFSATLDGAIDTLVRDYQSNPSVHEVADEETGDVVHHFWVSERPERAQLTAEIIERVGPTIVFSRTRHGADRIAKQLGNAGVSATAIHGARSQAQRERALKAFHRGEVKALVATDVAARGIHVEGVMCVVHFDLPADHKDYVHRSGRTGRAGNLGTVVALVPANQKRDAAKLRKAAGIDAELVQPDLSLLPEGHAAFRAATARGASDRKGSHRTKPERIKTDRPGRERSKPGRSRSEWDTTRPSTSSTSSSSSSSSKPQRAASDRPQAKSSDRPDSRADERSERRSEPARPSHTRPRPGRTEREVANLSSPISTRASVIEAPVDGPNRAERRKAQFDDAERARRAEANAKAAKGRSTPPQSASKGASKGSSHGSASASSSRSGDLDVLDRSLAGSDKVRPSGASRRKAKREALVAAGVEVPRAKKKRSGKPRPPKRTA